MSHAVVARLLLACERNPLHPRPKPRRLVLDVVEKLTDSIRAGVLRPGAKLPAELKIRKEFGVSRAVVREALSNLQALGMVQTRHGIGTFVTGAGAGNSMPFSMDCAPLPSLQDAMAALELRIGLETESAGLAARRRTTQDLRAMGTALAAMASLALLAAGETMQGDAGRAEFEFHLALACATHSPHFVSVLAALGPSSMAHAYPHALSVEPNGGGIHAVYLEHVGIYNAIVHQDSDAARAAMRTHLGNSCRRCRAAMAVQTGRRSVL
jgi:GntR family transcriptional repressor for pyruvate dehydrogenase complex